MLRLESDKLKTSYENRIVQMEDDFKMRIKGATTKKAAGLAQQLEDTRAYYTKKVKELESQVIVRRQRAPRGLAQGWGMLCCAVQVMRAWGVCLGGEGQHW